MRIAAPWILVFVLCILYADATPRWGLRSGVDAEISARSAHVTRASQVVTKWFTQKLDHFDPTITNTWQQKYMYNDQFWDGKGPVLLFIGGESPLASKWMGWGAPYLLAQDLNAILVGLEHRYYGESQPRADWSAANLKYLSSQQAMMDMAAFTEYFDGMLAGGGMDPNSTFHTLNYKWISIGGSYSGALSAWYRLKYPQLVVGAWASSAPVWTKEDYFEYDQAVRAGLGVDCAASVHEALSEAETNVLDPVQAPVVKGLFGCSKVDTPEEFLFVIADVVSSAVQYDTSHPDRRTKLCEDLSGASTASGKMTALGQWVVWMFAQLGTNAWDWEIGGGRALNTTIQTTDFIRPWMYQSCTEFGYFQTAPAQNPLRSTLVNVAWYRSICRSLFGLASPPAVSATNAYYGSTGIRVSNTTFINGGADPWRLLSMHQDQALPRTVSSTVIPGTSHCADLYEPAASDPEALVQSRAHTFAVIKQWVNGTAYNLCPADASGEPCSGHGVCQADGRCACYLNHGTQPDCSEYILSAIPLWVFIMIVVGIGLATALNFVIWYRRGCFQGRSQQAQRLLNVNRPADSYTWQASESRDNPTV